jgi:hypothetical protein
MHLFDLWLPILVSAVAVFVAAAVICVATPFHRRDFLAHERSDEVAEWIRRNRPERGRYTVGWSVPRKGERPADPPPDGPRSLLLVDYGPMPFGKSLGAWLLHLGVVATLVGYLASLALGPGARGLDVFRVTSVAALLAHGGGALPRAIWDGVPWRLVPAALFDAVVHAAVTGAVFVWLWPS